MPELENNERISGLKKQVQDQAAEIADLKRITKALIKAVQDAEKEIGEPLMPTGEYYGIKFE